MFLAADGTGTSWSEVTMGVVFGFGFLVLLTVVFVVVVRAYVDSRKTRMTVGNEEKLQELVRRLEKLTEATVASQERAANELAELRTRIASLEQLLRSVDG